MSEILDPAQPTDAELLRITGEEERCLARVSEHLSRRLPDQPARDTSDYDAQMLDLRDQIAGARLEDVPPLLEQMERLHSLSTRRRELTEVHIDPRSPYFGHLELEESGRQREVLIGRSTYLDTNSGIRIVDWRDAPVSRLFYRYDEGDDYEEVFGDREVSGTVVTRRSVSIVDAALRRIQAKQGVFAHAAGRPWRRLEASTQKLTGGAGSAIRAEQHHRPGQLGVGSDGGDDKHLKEITPLLDPRQFELITSPDSGLVVIQGGAGSGKTTIGLHRLAYLAFRDPRRFRADRVLIVVFNDALARYISQVLPALGIPGVAIRTYEAWCQKQRQSLFPRLPSRYREDTPGVVTRLKKHPAMLTAIEAHVGRFVAELESELEQALARETEAKLSDAVRTHWRRSAGRPVAHRLHALRTFVEEQGGSLGTDARVALERLTQKGLSEARDVTASFADLLSDREVLGAHLERFAPGQFSRGEIDRCHAWCLLRIQELLSELDTKSDERGERTTKQRSKHKARSEAQDASDDQESDEPQRGVDGADVGDVASLDLEDDSLILRLSQKLRGPLTRGASNKEALIYEHILIDEAQDLSPVELAVVLDTASPAQSITLAGDTQQRLLMDNGFSNWQTVLAELGLQHVEVEPLRLSYRSTHEIMEFSRGALGHLATPDEPQALRHGAPVELFTFTHTGDAVAFLGESLRELLQTEPSASVAVIARFPEQAQVYYEGLRRAEVAYLRHIAEQDFPFKPGVDVTDVRQVKGLEFDYVVLVEVSEASYPEDDEARHLLHIAATRAAHQLWLVSTGKPSPLVPEALRERAI